MLRYRASLYNMAYAIAKEESVGRELADSLYADLYGMPRDSGERKSKLRYYMGRGSLEGWLRTVMAQEFVNHHRRTRHELSLEEKVEAGAQFSAADENPQSKGDPRLEEAIQASLDGLGPEERFLLSSYYLDGHTLAEIARVLHVHESTISRKLERLVVTVRKNIRSRLTSLGLSRRQADELVEDVDVRDLNVNVQAGLRQETETATFYRSTKEKGTSQ